jgi:ABC-type dipeptide/oligopeptide/nickel transport system permease subunit
MAVKPDLTTDERENLLDRIRTLETGKEAYKALLLCSLAVIAFFFYIWAIHPRDFWGVVEDYDMPTLTHTYSFWLSQSKVTYVWHYEAKGLGHWFATDKNGKPAGMLQFGNEEGE